MTLPLVFMRYLAHAQPSPRDPERTGKATGVQTARGRDEEIEEMRIPGEGITRELWGSISGDQAEREFVRRQGPGRLLRSTCSHVPAQADHSRSKAPGTATNLNLGTEGIQAAFEAAHQQTDQQRQDAYEEFKRLYKLSPDAEETLEQLIDDPLNLLDDPLADIELDFDLMAEFFAKLSEEELDELLYPFGK